MSPEHEGYMSTLSNMLENMENRLKVIGSNPTQLCKRACVSRSTWSRGLGKQLSSNHPGESMRTATIDKFEEALQAMEKEHSSLLAKDAH